MQLFGRSSSSPGEVTRVTGGTSVPGGAVVPSGAFVPPPDGLSVADGDPVTPVPTRLQRLAAVVDRARPGRGGRNVRKWLETIGMSSMVFGFVCILLGWYGAAHSPYLYQEVPYLISGGLLGVALVIGGGVLVRCGWSMRQVEEDRRNALAIVRSVDRLERILRSLDETRRVEQEEHSL
jgi:hypothetical protein